MPGRPGQERRSHWVKNNHQERMPHRWIAMDTEAWRKPVKAGESQSWRCGVAISWRDDLKTGDARQVCATTDPDEMWRFVTSACKPRTRTVLWAHNLSYDARISRMFTILPKLGWHLDWFNLSEQVSTIVWRSEYGTLVCADLASWLPTTIQRVAGMAGTRKKAMPLDKDPDSNWLAYCYRDAEVVEKAVRALMGFVRSEGLGNWQPTGAGMMYATWRHKFLGHHVLVHDDVKALEAERAAMHTGRAEAWRHGTLHGDVWSEYDMRMAYCQIAAECDLPLKLKYHDKRVTLSAYRRMSLQYRCLARVTVRTDVPVVPFRADDRTLWPVGEFETWLWDTEIDLAIGESADVEIHEMYRYTKAPVLREWAGWCLRSLDAATHVDDPMVAMWIKHGSRALIGRIALRSRTWELWGDNVTGETGTELVTDTGTGDTFRVMHAGDVTLRESEIREGDSSCPQITSWIMSECRARLWRAMRSAGLDSVAHVDTDALIVRSGGRLGSGATAFADVPGDWRLKGAWRTIAVHGPRNIRMGAERKVSGVPLRARETASNKFVGEKWESLATSLSRGSESVVVVRDASWQLKPRDPRRQDDMDRPTYTVAVQVGRWQC